MAWDDSGQRVALHALWMRRHTTKFYGVLHPVQRAAEAVYSAEGQQQVRALIDGYLDNARTIRRAFEAMGFACTGGENAPYVWIDAQRDAWRFSTLPHCAGVVCTPGVGFGRCGQQHVRISAFNSAENVANALQRIRQALQ